MLEEVQMPVALGHRVVHGMLAVYSRRRKTRARSKVDSDRELATGSVEVDPGHVPRWRNSQRRLKQLIGHHELSTPHQSPLSYPLRFQQRLN